MHTQQKIKLCFVVVRYGNDVVGGAEMLTRLYAEQMSKHHDVTVVTTKAKDHATWEDYYAKEEEVINGVRVKRFSVDHERDTETCNAIPIFHKECNARQQVQWMKAQGPYSSSLLSFIKKNKHNFDFFIFAPYLYASTYFGYQLVKDKAVLIPAAHDEPVFYIPLFKKMFHEAAGMILSTVEELELIRSVYRNFHVPAKVIGVGLEQCDHSKQTKNFKKVAQKYNITHPYILYIGRIEEGKGVDKLFHLFHEYKMKKPSPLNLVLAGKSALDIPQRNYIQYLGFVSMEEKYTLMKNAVCLVNPSQFESLSIIIMEAWQMKKPVLVNGLCEVLKGQVLRAQGGLWYRNEHEFAELLDWFLSHSEECRVMGENGYQYVNSNYNWDIIEKKCLSFFEELLSASKKS